MVPVLSLKCSVLLSALTYFVMWDSGQWGVRFQVWYSIIRTLKGRYFDVTLVFSRCWHWSRSNNSVALLPSSCCQDTGSNPKCLRAWKSAGRPYKEQYHRPAVIRRYSVFRKLLLIIKSSIAFCLCVCRRVYLLTVAYRGEEGFGVFKPHQNSQVLTKLSWISSSVENTSVTT
jgi:hypothetical protein